MFLKSVAPNGVVHFPATSEGWPRLAALSFTGHIAQLAQATERFSQLGCFFPDYHSAFCFLFEMTGSGGRFHHPLMAPQGNDV